MSKNKVRAKLQNCLACVFNSNVEIRIAGSSGRPQLLKSYRVIYSYQIRVLRRMNHLPKRLLEENYFKTVVPQVAYCICVWGSCSVSMFNELQNLHVRAGRIIHHISKNFLDSDVFDFVKWEDLGYLYKRRLAIEIYKINRGLNGRLSPFVNFTESKPKGPLLEFRRTKTDLERNSVYFRGPIVLNSNCQNLGSGI